jgi:hypothetical protein
VEELEVEPALTIALMSGTAALEGGAAIRAASLLQQLGVMPEAAIEAAR